MYVVTHSAQSAVPKERESTMKTFTIDPLATKWENASNTLRTVALAAYALVWYAIYSVAS